MKIIAAMDSMKGSLSSREANEIVKRSFEKNPRIQVETVTIADGGEGTVAAFLDASDGVWLKAQVHNSSQTKINSGFGWLAETKTAVIEAAAASGIQFSDGTGKTHPLNTSSVGTGELVLAAVNHGAKRIIIGLGGTGTIDGGMGALQALGVRFYDGAEQLLPAQGSSLGKVKRIDRSQLDQRLASLEILLAVDVQSPLTGPQGAVELFGPQKGLRPEEVPTYEAAMTAYQQVLLAGQEPAAGDGAAGGLGVGLRQVLHGSVVSGLTLLAEESGLEEKIRQADLVITGEGRLDSQSLQGKVPIGVGRLAQKWAVPALAFAGDVTGDSAIFKENGIAAAIPIVDQVTTLEQALAAAADNLERAADRTRDLLFLLNN